MLNHISNNIFSSVKFWFVIYICYMKFWNVIFLGDDRTWAYYGLCESRTIWFLVELESGDTLFPVVLLRYSTEGIPFLGWLKLSEWLLSVFLQWQGYARYRYLKPIQTLCTDSLQLLAWFGLDQDALTDPSLQWPDWLKQIWSVSKYNGIFPRRRLMCHQTLNMAGLCDKTQPNAGWLTHTGPRKA